MKEKKELGEIGRREERREERREGRVKGRIVMVMMVVMVMGCNSGGVKDTEKVFLSEMVNLGKGFLDVFVSFGDMITGTLGIKADTKKSDIGKYFSDIEKTMNSVKEKLQEEVSKNGQYEKVRKVVEEFINGIVDKIAAGAKEAALGASGSEVIGNAVKNEDAKPAEAASVNALVKGIKEIVGVVLKDNEGNAGATKTGDTEKKSVGKLLGGQDKGEEAIAAAASATIGAVSGADILKAISVSGETSVEPTIQAAKNAAEIAAAKKEDDKEFEIESAKKDAVIAGGIALRGMAKGGKFAAKTNEEKSANAVNGAVASAVNKVLSTLVIAIRNTVDEGLKGINKVLGEIKQGEGSEVKSN
ncbi:Variable outer membrane protein (plasmid) [Borrelia crocidurae DOU]|uniref:Variable large protein n=1 Tax=Borrelia crocidurae DOU TaxID=1293575 RepID=W5SLV1_9SPIR|nr:variable large family protein [Borrelia crocidurae]AHH07852.1 Variable outer membrane protein [Borrelia crocidurae DOU]